MPKVTQPISGRARSQSQVCLGLKFTALNLPRVFPPQLPGVRPAINRSRRKETARCISLELCLAPFLLEWYCLIHHLLLESK